VDVATTSFQLTNPCHAIKKTPTSAASTLRIRIPVFVSYAAKSSYAEANPHFWS